MTTSFHGSCHCGAVCFRCELDAEHETSRCNCSVCAKSRFWKAFVGSDAFTLLQGADAPSEYRFGARRIAHRFCRHCGVKLFGHGGADVFPNAFYAINIACLDDLPDDARARLGIVYQDGRDDHWERAPAQTAHL